MFYGVNFTVTPVASRGQYLSSHIDRFMDL